MDKQTALTIIEQLAGGVDPLTGVVFPADSPYQHPDTVRALFFAIKTLQTEGTKRQATESAPQNAGKPWSADEDQTLVTSFAAGTKIPAIATQHQRSAFAIEARLAKLGKIAPPPNMRGMKAESERAQYGVPH